MSGRTRLGALSALLIVACTSPSTGGSAAVGVQASSDASGLDVTIGNGLSEAIFLPGCNQFLIEQNDGGTWKTARQKQCFWEGYAVEVAAGKSSTFHEEALPPGEYRIKVEYSLGCAAGKPLSQAGCKSQGTALSPSFRAAR